MRRVDKVGHGPRRPAVPPPHPDYAFPPTVRSQAHSLSGHSSLAHAQADPYAGLRRHVPRSGLLEAAGQRDVDALVATVNALLAARGMPPLSRGEFPTSRAAFLRVLGLARTLRPRG